ncbi:Lipoyl synthase [Candidatus Annandia adelgestsuga]|uniref:Lipoyl synthase n=1 Tax=Candidatus Annandia adelgestsuga TaxID=1302411 RepID=A0A3Q9CMC1_9ENTR|nr:lipoyl synthase [Candidatus Annandia adelgestsuga]AZP36354.1 Lipoyl synthase [Candidatus Annandia adelgestsuga]
MKKKNIYSLKIKLPYNFKKINNIKNILRKYNLNSVCEEASCPNLTKCFNKNTATFMILGSICTRKCPFCNIKYGKPLKPSINEPKNLAKAIKKIGLQYVVITSVDRDDLYDGGAQQFVNCIKAIKKKNNKIKIEILVPDFKRKLKKALKILSLYPPDIFNHNIENVPRLYKKIKPGANYKNSLLLLKKFKNMFPNIPTKSGLIVGLGETFNEIVEVIYDLYINKVTMLTIGQYLQPNKNNLSVYKFWNIKDFNRIKKIAENIGFKNVFCGPLIRSSYNAALQQSLIK